MINETPFPETAPDFHDPIGLMKACHRRILHHCDTLERLAQHMQEKGVDADARKAAGDVYRYFSKAGKHHHDDEEIDLFPFMARQSLKLADVVHRLRQQHEILDQKWTLLSLQLERIAALQDFAAFAKLAGETATLYREHIALEEDELLDIAVHILSRDDQEKIGKAMAERRGQRFS